MNKIGTVTNDLLMCKKGNFSKPISCHNLCNIKFGDGSDAEHGPTDHKIPCVLSLTPICPLCKNFLFSSFQKVPTIFKERI